MSKNSRNEAAVVKRVQRRRFTVFSISLVGMLSGIGFVVAIADQHKDLRSEREQLLIKLEEVRAAAQKSQLQASLAQASENLLNDARQRGFMPEEWIERKYALSQFTVSRSEAERLVRETVSTPNRLFGVEQFDLSASAGESLFEHPYGPDSKLRIDLKGTALMREIVTP